MRNLLKTAKRGTTPFLPQLPSLRDFIQMYRLDANKALSQNFLMDMNLTRKIVKLAGDITDSFVVEVGPGPGGITRAVLEQPCKRFDVVEIDRQFLMALEHLRDFAHEKMNIHRGDILKTDIGQIWEHAAAPKSPWLEENPPFRILGNLPFHISTPLVIKLLKEMAARRGPFQFGRVPLIFTFQSEVANRIVAPFDSDKRSRIGVTCQNMTEPKILLRLPGKCFTPVPEIDVCLVRFVPRLEPQIPAAYMVTEKVFRQVFHFKRRHLFKGAKTLYPEKMAHQMASDLLTKAHIDPTRFVMTLAMEELASVCAQYERHCREIPGLFLFDYRHPKPLEVLAGQPNPFPPEYKRPVEALRKIDEEGIPLNEFNIPTGMEEGKGLRGKRK